MAFDLKAILRLDDKFSGPMAKVARQTARTEKAMDTLAKSTTKAEKSADRTGRSFGKMGGDIGSATKGLGVLTGVLGGVAAAYGVARGAAAIAMKTFESTVLEAAKFEQSNVIIGAMFDDKKLAKQYTDMVDRITVKSPILDSQSVFANSKSFISLSKSTKELEKMWGLAERMAAIDPVQGVEGSVMALRELFSGDSMSMVERFEMPRQIMNEIKKLPIEQQLVKLDEYFNKIGLTTKVVDAMGGTTLGLWARVREQFALVLRDMGAPSLEVISGFLSNLIAKLEGGDFSKAANVGAKIIQNILTGLTNTATTLINWFTGLTQREDWKKATSLSAKVGFIIEDLFAKFEKWLDGGGNEKIEKVAAVTTEFLGAALTAAREPLMSAGTEMGKAIGKGVIEGAVEYMKENAWKVITAAGSIATNSNPIKVLPTPKSIIKKGARYINDRWFGGEKSHNGGLGRVPYNGYSARLHKDEMVLNRGEAAEYRAQKQGKGGGNTYQFNVTLGGGSTEQQAEQLFDLFVKKVEQAGGAGA